MRLCLCALSIGFYHEWMDWNNRNVDSNGLANLPQKALGRDVVEAVKGQRSETDAGYHRGL